MDPSREGLWLVETNNETTFPRKISLPTIATEAVLLLCIIDAEEERDVTIIDIPNVFIQMRVEDGEDMAIIEIHGVLKDILICFVPNVYKSYVMTHMKEMKHAGTVPEHPIWCNGCKPTLLL
jgi:hypothetical protein